MKIKEKCNILVEKISLDDRKRFFFHVFIIWALFVVFFSVGQMSSWFNLFTAILGGVSIYLLSQLMYVLFKIKEMSCKLIYRNFISATIAAAVAIPIVLLVNIFLDSIGVMGIFFLMLSAIIGILLYGAYRFIK